MSEEKLSFQGAIEAIRNGQAATRAAWWKEDKYLVESDGILLLLKSTLPGFTKRREIPWVPQLDDVLANDWSAAMGIGRPEGDENRESVLSGTDIYPKDPLV